MTKQEHQFGNCTFRRTVITTDDSYFQQLLSCFVTMHFHAACTALGYIHDNDIPFDGLRQQFQEPLVERCVSTTERFQDNTFQPRNVQYALHDLKRNTWKQFQYRNVTIQQIMRLQRTAGNRIIYLRSVVFNMYPGMSQWRLIIRTECVKVVGIGFTSTIPTHQLVFKKDTNFWNNGETSLLGCRYFNSCYQVLLAVCP